jgi:hypothetical protein
MDNKKSHEFLKALGMEQFKERLIRGRVLTADEAVEVLSRTLKLFSAGKYKPDPDLEGYFEKKWFDGVDINDYKSLVKAFKDRQIEEERLRMKFIKERELAEIKDSNPDGPGEERK